MPRKLKETDTQISTHIATEVKARLRDLCTADLRTLRGELEWLIGQEHERRQHPRQLVDTPEQYAVALENRIRRDVAAAEPVTISDANGK